MEHSVVVSFLLQGTDLGPYLALNDAARAALPEEHDGWGADEGAGEWVGDTGAERSSEFNLYFYGADAAEMWGRLRPVLTASPLMAGAEVSLRFGPAQAADSTAGERA